MEGPVGRPVLACDRELGLSPELRFRCVLTGQIGSHPDLSVCFGHTDRLFRDIRPGMPLDLTVAQETCGKELGP